MLETAALASSLWLAVGSASWHSEPGYNNVNPGVGIEYRQSDAHRFAAGAYRNSIRQSSRYVTYAWLPLSAKLGDMQINAGLTAGLVDGYKANNGRVIPVALPMLAVEYGRVGANLVAWPRVGKDAAGVAVQLRLMVW